MQIQHNTTPRTEKPKYIVIHTTGNTKAGANAEAHYHYWNSGKVGSSADFVVDDEGFIQLNDYNKNYTWHCGDGKGKYGITNSNSIGIEICINEDGDFDKAVENAIELVKELKLKTGITQVVRHYDASRKVCPAEFAPNNWEKWHDFLAATKDTIKELESVNDIVWELAEKGIITDKDLWLNKLNKDTNAYWLARKTVNYMRGIK